MEEQIQTDECENTNIRYYSNPTLGRDVLENIHDYAMNGNNFDVRLVSGTDNKRYVSLLLS